MTFNVTLTAPFDIVHSTGFALSVKFPTQFSSTLVNVGDKLYCGGNVGFTSCSVTGDREIQFQAFTEDIKVGETLNFVVYGLTNPHRATSARSASPSTTW